jgi:hypothetical protein
MPSVHVPPAALELAQRLRQLRAETWPTVPLTQAALARAFSAEESVAAGTISSWESSVAPKLPPRHRIVAYARFFATQRSITLESEPRLLSIDELTAQEAAACRNLEEELLRLRNAAGGRSAAEETVYQRSWLFTDNGPATLVCSQLRADDMSPLAEPTNPNYTELLKYADLDALVELHGHIRAENPAMNVYFRASTAVESDHLTGHLILVGGVAWNEITARLSEMADLPVRQVGHTSLLTGDIFVTGQDGDERMFWPKWRGEGNDLRLVDDVGLLVRVPNPLNSSRTLTICNGIHSRGVYGAVRSLTDERLRDANERYITNNFGSAGSFIILMSVKVIEGQTMTPDFNIPGVVLQQWKWPLAEGR